MISQLSLVYNRGLGRRRQLQLYRLSKTHASGSQTSIVSQESCSDRAGSCSSFAGTQEDRRQQYESNAFEYKDEK